MARADLYRRGVSTPDDAGALRRGTLAASVLHDIPLQPGDDGVLVGRSWDDRGTWTPVAWTALATAVAGVDPESTAGRLRLRDWLRGYLLAAGLTQRPELPHQLVALALPVGHVLHPGPGWAREQVLGRLLDVGLGVRQDPLAPVPEGHRAEAPAVAVPLPPGALLAADVDPAGWWTAAAVQRDAMATLAAERLQRGGDGVIRPIGGCDVLTLLSGRPLRAHLARADGTGLRAVAVPVRSRGWCDLARIDPAFVGAASAATAAELRGVSRPLLVTSDEVSLAPSAPPAELARVALADPAGPQSLLDRDVLYR